MGQRAVSVPGEYAVVISKSRNGSHNICLCELGIAAHVGGYAVLGNGVVVGPRLENGGLSGCGVDENAVQQEAAIGVRVVFMAAKGVSAPL